jgi:hypothetical protein
VGHPVATSPARRTSSAAAEALPCRCGAELAPLLLAFRRFVEEQTGQSRLYNVAAEQSSMLRPRASFTFAMNKLSLV